MFSKTFEKLEHLGHHDILDLTNEKTDFWSIRRALGRHSLSNFRAIHHDVFASLIAGLPYNGPAQMRALRARLVWLLGDVSQAKRMLIDSFALSPNAWAAGWLGEIMIYTSPRRSLALLAKAANLDPSWAWPHLWSAAALLQLGREESAKEKLDVFARLDQSHSYVAGVLRFEASIMARRYNNALAEAEALIAVDPANPAGYEASGRALQLLGRRSEAMARGHDVRDLDFDASGGFIDEKLGIYLGEGNPEVILDRIDAAIKVHPRIALLYVERAELRRHPDVCRYAEALEDYTKAVALEPKRAWFHAVLGRAKNNMYGGRAGLDDLNRGVRLSPQSGWIRAWRGALFMRIMKNREAIADFKVAQRLMPWYSFSYAWRGSMLNRKKDFVSASHDLDMAIRLDSTNAFSRFERFKAKRALKDYEGALLDLNEAFAIDPKYVWNGDALELDVAIKAHPQLGWLYAWRGWLNRANVERALADFNRAIVREGRHALILCWRARLLHRMGREDTALSDLQEAVTQHPRLWVAHQVLAEIRETQGKRGAALRSISTAARLAPTTVDFLLTKARLEIELGRWDKSLSTTMKALEMDSSNEEARLIRGRALVSRALAHKKAGEAGASIADFRLAFELAPNLFPPEYRKTVSNLTRVRGSSSSARATIIPIKNL